MLRPLTCVIFYLLSLGVSAETPSPFIYSQAVRDVAYERLSSTILERDFHLLVRLPDNYNETEDNLPVVYLLDGGATFPGLAGYYHYLSLEGSIPDLIIVGISYGSGSFSEGNMRSIDYTAASEERDYWGGAPKFQQVLTKEIVPLIELTYRADANRRILFGQSIGGQFVLFNALNAPEHFYGHIASNPALHRNLDYFLGDFSKTIGRTRLYVSSGSSDEARFRQPALKFMQHWQQQNKRPFKLRAESLDGYGHFSILPESFRLGLTYIFEDAL